MADSDVHSRDGRGVDHGGGEAGEEFDRVWLRHGDEIRARCRVWMVGDELGDEAFSRTATVALRRFAHHRHAIVDPRRWLLRVAFNTCIDLHRHLARERRRAVTIEAAPLRMLIDPTDPERALLRDEQHTILRRLVELLGRSMREPLQLLMHGNDVPDIARRLGMTEANVRKRLQRAREKIAPALASYRTGDGALLARELRSTSVDERESALTAGMVVVLCDDGVERDAILFRDWPVQRRAAGRIAALEAYVRAHPNGWKKRLQLARALREEGRFDEAAANYRAVIAQRSSERRAVAELAETLALLGRADEARATWSDECDAQTPREQASAAELLLREGRPAEALQRLESTLAGAARRAPLLALMHDALEALGCPAAAAARLGEAEECDASDPLVRERVIALRARSGASTPQGSSSLRDAADVGSTQIAIASRLLSLDRVSAARATLERFLTRHPRHARAWAAMAAFELRGDNLQRATACALRAREIDPHDWRVAVEVAATLDAAGESSTARAIVAETLVRHRASWSAHVEASRAIDWQADDAGAIANVIEGLLALEPRCHRTWLAVGSLLVRCGERSDAEEALRRAWDALPPDDAFADAARIAVELARCAAADAAQAYDWLTVAIRCAGRLQPLAREEAATLLRLSVKMSNECGGGRL